MAAHSLDCVPDSDEEAPGLQTLRQTALTDCEGIVSDGEDVADAWQQQSRQHGSAQAGAAVQAWAEDPADGVLRQLNAQLLLPPPSSSQQCQGAAQGPKGFRRRTLATTVKPMLAVGAGGRAAARPSFRRIKTAEAAQADRAAAEQAGAEEAELAAALAAAQAATAEEGPAEAQRLPPFVPAQPTRQEQEASGRQHAAVEQLPTSHPSALSTAMPPASRASGPSFLNRRALTREPSGAQEARQQAQGRGDPPAEGPCPTALAEAPTCAGGAGAADMGCSSAANCYPSGQRGGAAPCTPAAAAAAAPDQAPPARPRAGIQATTAAAAGAAAAASRPATFHRTADGLNVVFLNREQPSAGADAVGGKAASRGGKGKTGSVNSGWGNNFVKMDLKVGGVARGGTACLAARRTLPHRAGPSMLCSSGGKLLSAAAA